MLALLLIAPPFQSVAGETTESDQQPAGTALGDVTLTGEEEAIIAELELLELLGLLENLNALASMEDTE